MANGIKVPSTDLQPSELEELSPMLEPERESILAEQQAARDNATILQRAMDAGYKPLEAGKQALETPYVTPEGIAAALVSGGITGLMTSSAPTAFGAFMTGAVRRAFIDLELGLISEATDIITQNKIASTVAPLVFVGLKAGLSAFLDKGVRKAATGKLAESLQEGMSLQGNPISIDKAEGAASLVVNKIGGWRALARAAKVGKFNKQLSGILKNQSGAIDPELLGIPGATTPEKAVGAGAKTIQSLLQQEVFRPAIEAVEAATPGIMGKLAEAAKVKEIKPTIRQMTGQVKASEVLVSEDKALKSVMKAQARASRKAFSEGKKTGVQVQKEHVANVKEAAAIRDELKNRVNSAVNTIKQQPKDNLPLEYKKAISGIQDGIGVKGIKPGFIFKQAKLRKLILEKKAAGENIDILDEELNEISGKSPQNLTVEELESYANLIKQITYVGTIERKMIKVQEGAELKEVLSEITDRIKERPQPQAIPEGTRLTGETKKAFTPGKVKKFIKAAYLKDKRPRRIFNALDNYETNGPNYNNIVRPIDDAATVSYAGQQAKVELVESIINQTGLDTSGEFFKLRAVNEHLNLSGEEAMEVYNASFDEGKLAHLMNANNFTAQDVTDTINALTPEEKVTVDQLQEQYWKPQYDETNAVYQKLYNNDLPNIEGYSQIRLDRDLDTLAPTKPELKNALFGKDATRRTMARGFIKTRAKEAKQPLSLKFFDNLYRNIEEVEHYNAYAETARDVQKIIFSPEYRDSVTKALGKEGYGIIKNWFTDTITRRPYVQTSAAPIVKMLRNHSVVGMLGMNIITGLKQTASLPIAAAYEGMSGQAILNGLFRMAKNPKENINRMYEKSPAMKGRAVERDIVELLRSEKAVNIFKGKKSLSSLSMEFIRQFDKFTVSTVWNGAYEVAIKTMPEEDAVSYANGVINETQPAFDIKDLPAFFRGGELEKMLTMFQNQRNQNWNIFSHDIVEKLYHKKITKKEALRKLIWMWVVPAFILGAAQRGRFKRTTKEAALDAVKFSPIAGAFLIGSVADAMISGWDWNTPVFQPVREVEQTVRGKKLKTKLKHGVKFLGYAAKIPVNQLWRTGEGAYELLTKKTDDLRRLIYSEYALREPDELRGAGLELEDTPIPGF
jgi:hypothetical protein